MTFIAEIIAIGTEVVMGEVINSNASWLSQKLAELGIDVYYHTAVGDNPNRIHQALDIAFKRSNLLIFTGGLGPTDDDLTIATLADYFKQPLHRDTLVESNLRAYFKAQNKPMVESNLKQADKPDTAEFLENRLGTAPGQFWDVSRYCAEKGLGNGLKIAIMLPGVPFEMQHIWDEVVVPKLKAKLDLQTQLYSKSLKFFGLGESALAEKIRDLMAAASPSVATYCGQAEVRVRIAVKAENEAAAKQLIQPVEIEILNRIGDFYYGQDDDTLEAIVIQELQKQGLTVATAESCTGGLLSSRLTDVSGSSAVVHQNVVTYSNAAKTSLLGVPEEILLKHGAVSEAVAAAMADGILALSKSDFGASTTGIAGPDGGSEEKPVGLAYIAISSRFAETQTYRVLVNARYARQKIKHGFSQYALFYLLKALKA